jgi:hypothetical protein
MIDFQSDSLFKLNPKNHDDIREDCQHFFVEGETVIGAFKTVRDQVVFTNKRVIAANVKGLTGSKVDYTSIPYSKIQAYSVETSGTFDMDCEIELYVSQLGCVKFEISGSFDLVTFNKHISEHIL